MASSLLFNRAKVATATTGTGTMTLGAAVAKYCTFAEAGVADGQVVTYTIEEGNDFEIGRGAYTASGTTLSRTTVLLSKIGGTAGTTKMTLAGAAVVFITAAKEDLDVNDFTEDTSPDGTADFHWMHDTSAALRKKVKPQNISRTGGFQLLASGTVSSASSLDIVLTSYTGFRGFIFILNGFNPVTDDVNLTMRMSTNGGSSYDAGASDYRWTQNTVNSNGTARSPSSNGATSITVGGTTAGELVGNGVDESANYFFELMNAGSTTFKPLVDARATVYASSNIAVTAKCAGHRNTAQDTDAVRFIPTSGNINAMSYAVIGVM